MSVTPQRFNRLHALLLTQQPELRLRQHGSEDRHRVARTAPLSACVRVIMRKCVCACDEEKSSHLLLWLFAPRGCTLLCALPAGTYSPLTSPSWSRSASSSRDAVFYSLTCTYLSAALPPSHSADPHAWEQAGAAPRNPWCSTRHAEAATRGTRKRKASARWEGRGGGRRRVGRGWGGRGKDALRCSGSVQTAQRISAHQGTTQRKEDERSKAACTHTYGEGGGERESNLGTKENEGRES